MFDFFKKDMPERKSPPEEAPEASSEADELEALFDTADTNGDAEAPDLEALRQALSARTDPETGEEAPLDMDAEMNNGQEKSEALAFEEGASAAPEEAGASQSASPPSVDEPEENGQAAAQHTRRLNWLVDFVSTEDTDGHSGEAASAETAQKGRPSLNGEAASPATEEAHEKDAEAQPPAKAPEVEPELTGEAPPAAEMPSDDTVDLEAFQRAIQAQQEEAFDADPGDDVVTDGELEALFGTEDKERRAEDETDDWEAARPAPAAPETEEAPEEAAPTGWKAESAYAPEAPRANEKTPSASSSSDEDVVEEPSETVDDEPAIGALYDQHKSSESEAPEAARSFEEDAPEAENTILEEDLSLDETEAAPPAVDVPTLESSEMDAPDDATAPAGEAAQPDAHTAPEDERSVPGSAFDDAGSESPEDTPGAPDGGRPGGERFTAAEEAPPAEAAPSLNGRSGGEPAVEAAETQGPPAPEKERGGAERDAWRPAARHEGEAEDAPSSESTQVSTSAPGGEAAVAVDTETAPDPADAAAEEEKHAGEAPDPDVLAGNLHTDVLPGEDITFKEKIASVQEDVLHGDGHLEELSEPSADGHTLDLGGNTPVANISNWMQGAQYASPPQEEAADEDEAAAADLDTSDRVVSFLLRSGAVTPEQVQEAQNRRGEEATALWRVLAEIDEIDREAIFAGAARVYAFPMADLERHGPNPDFTKSVLEGFSEEKREELLSLGVVPYRAVRERRREALKLLFITHDPARPEVNRLLERVSVEFFEVLYAPESAVGDIIAKAFPKKNEYLERVEKDGGMAVDLGTNYQEDDDLIDEDQLEAEISRSKLINLFEATLVEAVRQGASDIHIYPNAQKKVEIHFRIDGRLKHWHTEDKVHPEALLAVIKDNSMNVDRFERDAAQDGFIQRRVDEALIRFRVSVMPIANASQEVRSESIVIRVLDDRKVIKDLSKLGLLEGALEKFEHAISQPHGMVIMTGPTGSGKSTTLVAALHRVVSAEVNVLTIEDPVEYIIEDVRQIKLSHKLQLQDALRSLLRHDPDVVMVGEMRDRSTAELAIKLANTGHLTFSTLHTNDAPSAVARLYKMGIEPFLIAYAINLVVAQRLIRKLCPECKRLDGDPDPVMLQKLGFSEEEIASTDFYLPGEDENCPVCNGFGFKGRRAISEAMYFSREIRHMIVEADRMIDEDAIREQAQKEGMLTLRDSAREVVKMGETSVREMIRVVTSEAY